MKFTVFYREFILRILGRKLVPQDGIPAARIEATEARLGFCLPQALREYYCGAGNLHGINEKHNRLLTVEELQVEGNYLLFMEENQSVVWWRVRISDLITEDPEVWQGLNDIPLEWYSEKMSVSQFLKAIFLWTFALESQPQRSDS